MLIRIRCSSCGLKFQVHSRHAGKVGTCPHPTCGRKYLVPMPRTGDTADNSPEPVPAKPRQAKKKTVAERQNPPRVPNIRTRRRRPKRKSSAFPKFTLAAVVVFSALALGAWQFIKPQPVAVAEQKVVTNNELQRVAETKAHPATPEKFEKHVVPFFKTYCFDCHGNGAEEGGFSVEAFIKAESFEKDRKRAEAVFKMVNAGVMPPEDGQQPTAEERANAVNWMDAKLYYVDCELPPDPGRVTIRRLNRAEYNNTIRDLVGVDFEPAADFPSDEVGDGFDNIGDVLSLPPLLLEKYLQAAETIAKKAIVANPSRFASRTIAGKDLKRGGSAGSPDGEGFVTMASSGSATAIVKVPKTGEYTIRIEAKADQAGKELARMDFRVDGKSLRVFDVKGQRKPNHYEVKTKLTEGTRRLEAAFINDYYNPSAKDRRQRDRNLYVRSIQMAPVSLSSDLLPETHRRLIAVSPDKNRSAKAAFEENLKAFLPRAFRRPATNEEIEKFTQLGEFAASNGETFERSMQVVVTAVLVSPHFLFRVENGERPEDASQVEQVADYELASRLSYFLWSSMPDEELLRLASQGRLHQEDVLEQQTRRMLKDPKSNALVENFATQWLGLRNLDEVSPDPKLFPMFNENMRNDMQTETKLFFASIMNEDQSVDELLDAKYTFVNERLAKHYGIAGIQGDKFQKAILGGIPRAGVLTQASILTLTSNPNRTSPVKRGKWILENLLNEPPPPPPPNVPELEETAKESPGLTLREQLALHRESPGCAACHNTMDPLGLGFENFDAIGRWRERDGKHKVDASGELPGSGKFSGPMELIDLLKQRKAAFRRCLAEKLLTYALGRGLKYYDRCAVDRIVQGMSKDNHRFSRMVLEIVKSQPFLYKRGESPKAD